jgi:hypothetical protein
MELDWQLGAMFSAKLDIGIESELVLGRQSGILGVEHSELPVEVFQQVTLYTIYSLNTKYI